jgi:Flp pilus assembly protein TadB
MALFYVMSFLGFLAGIILIFNLTVENYAVSVINKLTKKKTLYSQAKELKNKRKNALGCVRDEILRMKKAMNTMGKEKNFAVMLTASFLLLIAGCVLSIVLNNMFLLPAFMASFALIPFGFAKKQIADYDRQIKEELETALSIITTSYVRNDDIVTAVSENLIYLKLPVKNLFEEFVAKCSFLSADMKGNIKWLKSGIKDELFNEWCDTLVKCQDDRNLKDTLMPIVAKYTDERIVNNELKGMMANVRWEYYMMVVMVLANIPLLKALNAEWYGALTDTLPGKFVLGVCGVTILVTSVLMMKYTKPVSYERTGDK